MAYATYTTEALVCGTFNRNTADRSYLLFTREAGMLYAEARSVREERSRQRMALQDFSLVRVSLIKGKQSWKVGSIESKHNFFMSADDKITRGSIVGVIRFIRRFYGGEEPAPALFDYLISALIVFSAEHLQREFIENGVRVHILLMLGYVDAGVVPPFIADGDPKHIMEHYSEETNMLLTRLIDKAVSLSHL